MQKKTKKGTNTRLQTQKTKNKKQKKGIIITVGMRYITCLRFYDCVSQTKQKKHHKHKKRQKAKKRENATKKTCKETQYKQHTTYIIIYTVAKDFCISGSPLRFFPF